MRSGSPAAATAPGRLIEAVLPQLGPAARAKTWLGYSDGGALLAALYSQGFAHLAHGPMPQDILRDGGEAAVARALAWLVDRDPGVAGAQPGRRPTAGRRVQPDHPRARCWARPGSRTWPATC